MPTSSDPFSFLFVEKFRLKRIFSRDILLKEVIHTEFKFYDCYTLKMNLTRSDPNRREQFRKIKIWETFRRWFRKLFIEPLVYSKCPPWYDARAVSLGLVTGLLIPVGGHLVTLTVLRVVFRFNYLVAFAFTFISNPIDMIPLYYAYYYLGSLILGKTVALDYAVFEKFMHPVLDKAYFWEIFGAIVQLGHELLIRWVTAAVIVSTIFGSTGYVLTYKIQKKRCKRAAENLGQKYEQYLRELEHDFHVGKN